MAASFQDHTDKLILRKKNKTFGNQSGQSNILLLRLSFCDAYYNDLLKRQILHLFYNYLFMIAAKRSSSLGFADCDTVRTKIQVAF